MKYIVRTTDENLRSIDYWIIDAKKEQQAVTLAKQDDRTTRAVSWSISPINNEFNPTQGGWNNS
ncbi:MAG TPA: hypothetical protein DCL76_03370 [Chloroflexi bacterium]|nr:hypothetical protein [Chloroflexota bacterium]|tara:strand:+ start:164 stop:355 length:192 start_codon:yes stop_codon:yes gene_type:complete